LLADRFARRIVAQRVGVWLVHGITNIDDDLRVSTNLDVLAARRAFHPTALGHELRDLADAQVQRRTDRDLRLVLADRMRADRLHRHAELGLARPHLHPTARHLVPLRLVEVRIVGQRPIQPAEPRAPARDVGQRRSASKVALPGPLVSIGRELLWIKFVESDVLVIVGIDFDSFFNPKQR
jgi:hypothetical protein